MRKLLFTTGSPFARAVRIVLVEKGLDFEREETVTTPSVEDRAKITPTLQVPALIDGELTIWDSAVIIDYLMTNYLGVAAPESMHSLAADYLCARGGKLARPARSRDVAYLWRVDDNGVAVAMVRDPI